MPYAIDVLAELGVIRVNFSGQVGVKDRAEALSEVTRLQIESQCRRLLVDLTAASLREASNAEMLEHAGRLANTPVMRHTRIAYVGDPAAGTGIECLAATQGYFYQRFRTAASALRWLGSGAGFARAA